MEDLDRIAAVSTEIKLSNGAAVSISRLRTREFFKLLKILTTGAGHMLSEFQLSGDLDQEEFTGKLIALVLLSVPEAEDEAIDFLKAMTTPVGLIEGRTLSSGDKAHNDGLWEQYRKVMGNPEMEDTIDIIEHVINTEAADIRRLGKRIMAMMKIAEKTGQLTPNTKPSIPTESSEDSPEPSISSPENTDGQTPIS